MKTRAVRDDHRLGAVDRGLAVALDGVNAGRMGMAATCLGLARWALDQAIGYAKLRKTFGVPIAEHQAVQLMLADSAMDIYAAKSMLQNCAWRIDAGWRFARVMPIPDGTGEIQRRTIARQLLAGRADL